MRSIRNLRSLPAGRSLLAEDLLEFHAARLLLLMRYCGAANRIDGLTKLAKLDFFVRYPAFFASACEALGKEAPPDALGGVEAPMVRHHYGPWDKRYYHVLAFLEGAGLVTVTTARGAGGYSFALTTAGAARADDLAGIPSFEALVLQMRSVKSVFGGRSGDSIKRFIYEQFDREVAKRLMGDVIT